MFSNATLGLCWACTSCCCNMANLRCFGAKAHFMTMQVMVITLYFFGRPSSGHPTICVRWPVNNCMMFVSLSGHQSSIVRWSAKTARCLSNFRPVFFVTLHRSKKTFRVTRSNISSEGVCTEHRCVHDFLADEDRCWAIAHIADYQSTTTVRVM